MSVQLRGSKGAQSRWLISLLGIAAGFLAAPAIAQVPAPPVLEHVDSNGVDAINGSFNVTATDISIGPAGSQGLVYTRFWTGGGWRSSIVATMSGNGASPSVSIGGVTETFTRTSVSSSGSTYQNDGSSSAVLIREGGSGSDYVYTSADGTIIRFMPSSGGTLSQFDSQLGWARSIMSPNGSVLKFYYKTASYSGPAPGGGTYTVTLARIQSITDNYGFQLKFVYASNTLSSSSIDAWQLPNRITAINNGIEYCDPNADTCSLSGSWPHSDYGYTTGLSGSCLTSVTDPGGRVWQYGYDICGYTGRLTSSRRPGAATDDTIVAYLATDSKVSSVQRLGQTWNYAYVDAPYYVRTTTITDPLSVSRNILSNTLQNVINSRTDELGLTTSYQYTGLQSYFDLVSKITLPEGNSTEYTYDSRANITSVIQHAKPGSGLTDLTTYAGYSTTCSNLKTCNKPNWTKDAKGNQTDYTYDATHGGVLTVTAPAPTVGAIRPQVRNTYTTAQAYYKNSAGAIVASGAPVYLLSQTSTCRTAASCSGTADEIRTTVGYGPQVAGTANNLLPVSATSGAGDGSLIATTTSSYDSIGNLTYLDGPLAGTADTTRTLYDAVRQVVGVIGPDPDGAGALNNRAARLTYNADGQVTLLEKGTTTGQSDANWTAFVSLQQVATTYDANARKASDALTAGGSIYSLAQYSYDAVGRLDCAAQRMNSAAWSSLPASACTAQTAGSAGPDRISKTSYDAASQVTKVQTAFGTTDQADEVASSYTNNGKLASVTDAQANTTTYEYDGFDRPVKTRYPVTTAGAGTSSSTDYEQLVYDANSNVTSRRLRGYASDSTQHIDFTYDAMNRVTLKDLPSPEYDVSYSYDLLSRPLVVGRPDGMTDTFAYDGLGRMSSDAQGFGSMSYQYDLAGNRTVQTWNDGFYVTYDHLVTGEVAAVRENGATSGAGVLATYTYDDLGSRTGLTRGNGTTTSYGFDAVSRLSSMSHDLYGTTNDLSLGFSYNPANQIASTTRSNDVYAYGASANANLAYTVNGLNQDTTVGAGSLGYDARGNLSSTGSNSYAYSSENLLKSATGGTTLYYDALGRLAEYDTSVSTRFLYDGSQMAAEIANPSGVVTRRYVYGPEDDEPLVWYEGSGTGDRRWLHADERGSVIAVTDSSGATIGVNSYDEYGVPASGNIGRFQYTGQAWLPELGLYYYKARMYSSRLGRFLQTDPIGYGDGLNWHNYAGGDPVNGTDPSGLSTGTNAPDGINGIWGSCSGSSFDIGGGKNNDPDRSKVYTVPPPALPGGITTYLRTSYSDGTVTYEFLRFTPDAITGSIGFGGSPSQNSSESSDYIIVKALRHPGLGIDPLDPLGINPPITPLDEMQIADTMHVLGHGNIKTLKPHSYKNRVSPTGAVLPFDPKGYRTFDVNPTSPRGAQRLIIGLSTGAMFYTKNHYASFFRITVLS